MPTGTRMPVVTLVRSGGIAGGGLVMGLLFPCHNETIMCHVEKCGNTHRQPQMPGHVPSHIERLQVL